MVQIPSEKHPEYAEDLARANELMRNESILEIAHVAIAAQKDLLNSHPGGERVVATDTGIGVQALSENSRVALRMLTNLDRLLTSIGDSEDGVSVYHTEKKDGSVRLYLARRNDQDGDRRLRLAPNSGIEDAVWQVAVIIRPSVVDPYGNNPEDVVLPPFKVMDIFPEQVYQARSGRVVFRTGTGISVCLNEKSETAAVCGVAMIGEVKAVTSPSLLNVDSSTLHGALDALAEL